MSYHTWLVRACWCVRVLVRVKSVFGGPVHAEDAGIIPAGFFSFSTVLVCTLHRIWEIEIPTEFTAREQQTTGNQAFALELFGRERGDKDFFALRPMPMETQSPKVFCQKYCFQRTAEKILVPPLCDKRKNISIYMYIYLFQRLQAAAICFFSGCKLSTRW